VKQKIKILVIILFITLFSCSVENERQEYAELIIEKVEKFKLENNRLPKNVTEIGLIDLENSKAFYEKRNDSTYIVWFGLGVGESKIYNSTTKDWIISG
jgi:hypothetical protein